MKNLEIEKFSQRLLKDFPNFINVMNPDDFQPYMLFGDFGIYIRDLIDHGSYDENELDKLFDFLNEMGNSSDEEVQNLLTVGVLEIITDSSTAMMLARKKLKGIALEDLILIQKYWAD
ncbi:MAG TPA: hypothetical protein VGH95_00805 [Candidatus Aquirickettsiella sp.]|jgi:hypothetical protein